MTACIRNESIGATNTDIPLMVAGKIHPELWPQNNIASAQMDSDTRRLINQLLAQMSLRQKIGQLIAVEERYLSDQDLVTFPIGTIIDSRTQGENITTEDIKSAEKAENYYTSALMADLDGGPFIPPMRLVDYRHAALADAHDMVSMSPIALGAAKRGSSNSDVNFLGLYTAETIHDLAVSGYDGLIVDSLGAGEYGFDVDPQRRAELISQYHVFLSQALSSPGQMIIGAGPFLETRLDDTGLNDLEEAKLIDLHGDVLPALLGQAELGPDLIMISSQSWHGRVFTQNEEVLRGLLRDRSSYNGILMNTKLDLDETGSCYAQSCAQLLRAGLDVIYAGRNWQSLFRDLLQSSRAGDIPIEMIDASVRRVLRAKIKSGGLTYGRPALRHRAFISDDRDRQRQQVIKTLVKNSAVLLKNSGQVLPLSRADQIIFIDVTNPAESDAESYGFRVAADFLQPSSGSLSRSFSLGDIMERPDIVILNFGLGSDHNDPHIHKQIMQARSKDIPVVTLWAMPYAGAELQAFSAIENSDAAVFYWPIGGPESAHFQAVLDLIFVDEFGHTQLDFHARLPRDLGVTGRSLQWGGNPLFETGYGLSYKEKVLANDGP